MGRGRPKGIHTKHRKPRLSREARSWINLENLIGSPPARAKAGWGQRRRKEMKGIPIKLLRCYTPDYVVLHRYCLLTGLTKVDAMHDLMQPLYAKVEELEAAHG